MLMTRVDYEHRGGPPYGRNRQLFSRPPASTRPVAYAVVKRSNGELVAHFDTREDALAELARLHAETSREFVIRKLA